MAKTFLRVIVGIIAIGFGAGFAYFWSTLNPADDIWTLVGVGAVVALASFSCMYFLTKGSGD